MTIEISTHNSVMKNLCVERVVVAGNVTEKRKIVDSPFRDNNLISSKYAVLNKAQNLTSAYSRKQQEKTL